MPVKTLYAQTLPLKQGIGGQLYPYVSMLEKKVYWKEVTIHFKYKQQELKLKWSKFS